MRAGFWEILLIVVLVLVLFGHNKIPALMKNMANGINIFKKEIKETKPEAKGPTTDNKTRASRTKTTSTKGRARPKKKLTK